MKREKDREGDAIGQECFPSYTHMQRDGTRERETHIHID